jgi:glutathionylspermidine synthase
VTAVGAIWSCAEPLPPDRFRAVLLRTVFDCCKWDNQVDDQALLCPFPLVLETAAWEELAGGAEALAREALAAEQELLGRPELHGRLGLPRGLRRCLARIAARAPAATGPRVMRFDFHRTAEGWRISEANTDVASGFIEGSGFTQLLAAHYPDCRPAGDPAGALADAVSRQVGPEATVGLMHLTVYTDDRQVMLYLAKRLGERGLRARLFHPNQLRWQGDTARVQGDGREGLVDLVVRFFPAEWLPQLPGGTGWERLLVGGRTPVCNPGYSALTQSKRFPLTWDRLATPLPTWRALLPETCSPREVKGMEDGRWVFKPALGHEGRDVGINGVSDPCDWAQITRAARKNPDAWAAQRRFESFPLATPEGPHYPCLGVYVIDGRAAGAYARMGVRPLIDYQAREVAVLVRR